ncbi:MULTISPECIES: bile acid:sodium symporter family protein [Nostoc]|uniref:Sodium dependent transporter n=1 Tax=Nostoc paludosum FACHB-159 TaxID=2692908 RepID=A0ABR8KJD6_9NOSO|nr:MULTISPECIES: bile acid:sodium symporter [Nostoc]MBD2683359.1 sodium dependent transporter [Nostoc sp. FACHB-857]MBD2739685.1 sodium dependent transporter [Nostoc paludosum FACHB-159]
MHHPLLLILVKVTIFSLMLAIGSNLCFEKMLSFWRKPALVFRALLAVVVLVPLVVILLLKLLNLPPEVMIGLALLAASPGAPLTTKRSQKAGGSFQYSASLQLTLAILAVFFTPLTLAIFATLFEKISQKVAILEVAQQVMMVQLLPVSLGILMQKFAPTFTKNIAQPLTFIADNLFLVMVVLVCILGLPLFSRVGQLPLVAIAIMVIASLGIGHTLDRLDDDMRATLAIFCIARNFGLALFVAILNHVQQQVIPTLVAYVILGAFIGVPYSIWNKRRLAKTDLS